LKINNIVETIQNTSWTQINNFSIHMNFVKPESNVLFKINNISEELLNAALISTSTPDYKNEQIVEYTGYEFRFHQGRDEMYRFVMTFRDFNSDLYDSKGSMTLYNIFRDIYWKGKYKYYDDIRMDIGVYTDDDFGTTKQPIFRTTTAIIESMSQLSFSHTTENQIAEFTISFMCNPIEI